MYQVCPQCHFRNPETAERCQNCGLFLHTTIRVKPVAADTPKTEPFATDELDPPPGLLAIYFHANNQPLMTQVSKEMTIGRFVEGGPRPVIDLEPFGAGGSGVSRIHATVLVPNDAEYYLQDLNSTNGTWVNKKRLYPFQPYALQSGDAIQLGQFIFFIRFTEGSPA